MARGDNKFEVEITGKLDDLKNAVENSKAELGGLGKSANNLSTLFAGVGVAIAGAFSVQAIADFAKESIDLAAKAEGIEAAFNRINGANLDTLRKSVQGTVDDVNLMKAAVQANNFKIPIEQLGTFFEFATRRAAQTGESVDYLVQSIITGIGRKSPLILDNLGISAVALKEKFGEVGMEAASIGEVAKAMGEIVNNELTKMGDVALTTAQRMSQIQASTENLKAQIGERMIPIMNKWYGLLNDVLGALNAIFESEGDKGRQAGEKMFAIINTQGRDAALIIEETSGKLAGLSKQLKAAQDELKYFEQVGRASNVVMREKRETVERLEATIEGLTASYMGWYNQTQRVTENTKELTKEQKRLNKILAERAGQISRSPLSIQAAASRLDDGLTPGQVVRTAEPILMTLEQIDLLNKMRHATETYNETLWLTQNLTADMGTAFANAIVSGEDFGEAMKGVLENVLKQLIAVVVQAALLSAILSALGGGAFGAVFGQVFNSLKGGSATGIQLTGLLQGSDILLSGQKSGYQQGRR